jgi:hypothetical protein
LVIFSHISGDLSSDAVLWSPETGEFVICINIDSHNDSMAHCEVALSTYTSQDGEMTYI